MAEDVALIGLIGEVLLQGRTNYFRGVGILFRGFQLALETESVKVDDLSNDVALTSTGNVRSTLSLSLSFPSLTASRIPGFAGSPVTIQLVSEYVLDATTGFIRKHQLMESRVKGQLTPGDVLSKLLQRWISRGSVTEQEDWMKVAQDAVEWFQSISKER